jgi:hypothetical protein
MSQSTSTEYRIQIPRIGTGAHPVSALLALTLGAGIAVVLTLAAQGTSPADVSEDWHGNVAHIAARPHF